LRAAHPPKANNSKAHSSHIHGRNGQRGPFGFGGPAGGTEVRRVVVMVSVEVTGPALVGFTEVGEAEQAACAGRPLQLIVTPAVNPASALTLTVTVALFPATTVVDVGLMDIPKSAPPPVNATTCGLLGAESDMVRAPVRAPKTVGVKVTLIVQADPAASAAPHVLVWAKSPEMATLILFMVAVPEFVSVTDCKGLVVFSG
jgi:hypothetical protein